MAWQLIYTSAPRSLEAGRSGFGTVARHRALSPLLVSAIERTSQFSRLPGVDTDRVIFSHRVVTVAGSRFHVLSSIRDAGADYTGRTNHIAHHLIVDPREIAQLGAGGPSPADVLLAMTWATSWTEHPRYLEAADEVALATLHARTTGTAWQRITGDPNQAGLLATGDASRGAYIIQPPGVDLREVFAESLRLMPERLWQISFTTSLQPSDESADFRWIGIEERSPLRAQSESSGRPVLNLASPGTLPLVEVAQPPAASPVRQSFAPTSAPVSSPSSDEGRTAWPATTSVTTQRPTHAPIERGVEWPSMSTPPSTRGNRKWWLLARAMSIIVAAASVAFFVGRPIYTKYKHRKDVSAEISTILTRTGFFSGNVTGELQKEDAIDIAKELATAGSELVEVARNADFAGMKIRRPSDELRQRAREAHLNLPKEIAELDERLSKITAIHQQLTTFDAKPDGYKAFADLQRWRSEIDQQKSGIFAKINGQIAPLADQRQAKALFVLVTGPSEGKLPPNEPLRWFEDALGKTKLVSEDGDAKKTLKAAQDLIQDWGSFEKSQSPFELGIVQSDLETKLAQGGNWPIWLRNLAQRKIADAYPKKAPGADGSGPSKEPPAPNLTSTPPTAQASPPKLYFFTDNQSLSFSLPAGDVPVKLFLRVPKKNEEEVLPYGPPSKSIPDERNLGPGGEYFRRAGGELKALKPPEAPYRLIIKRGNTEVARIFVGQPPSDEDWLRDISTELNLKPEAKIVGVLPELPQPAGTFKLKNSGDIDGTPEIPKTYTLEVDPDGKCNYEEPRNVILKKIEKLKKDKTTLQPDKQKNAVAKPPILTPKLVGDSAIKISNLSYTRKKKGEPKTAETYQPFVSLLPFGTSLANSPQDKNDTILENSQALQREAARLQKTRPDDRNLTDIVFACMKLNSALGDASAKAEEANILSIQENRNATELARIEDELARLSALSLYKDNKLPPGDYTLYVKPISLDPIKLRTFKIP